MRILLALRHWRGPQAPGIQHWSSMNRPRNQQPRSGRGNQSSGGSSGRGNPRVQRQQLPSSVPDVTLVVRGAAVSIVLKQDQATGHEVQGTVQDILTSGNHPRGIKVRLADGRVGRVQRMSSQPAATQMQQSTARNTAGSDMAFPPLRTLADFIPDGPTQDFVNGSTSRTSSVVVAQCPICNEFEGDEIAVSRHVEEHLT